MVKSEELAICVTCGTQFDAPYATPPKTCKICNDPRQYVPPTGQKWTSISLLQAQGFTNTLDTCPHDARLTFIQSVPGSLPSHLRNINLGLTSVPDIPKVGIGQRAILIRTSHGNVLWDCVPYIDASFVKEIEGLGGISAIVISHPHFYTTHLEWAKAFDCPVYLASEDAEWLARTPDTETSGSRVFIDGPIGTSREIVEGVHAIKCGGHFAGSMCLFWAGKLMHADTIMAVPSGLFFGEGRVEGTVAYSFMWSYPNMIPMSPEMVHGIWKALKPWDFTETYGGFPGQDIRRHDLKRQLLGSMKTWLRSAGWTDVALLKEEL